MGAQNQRGVSRRWLDRAQRTDLLQPGDIVVEASGGETAAVPLQRKLHSRRIHLHARARGGTKAARRCCSGDGSPCTVRLRRERFVTMSCIAARIDNSMHVHGARVSNTCARWWRAADAHTFTPFGAEIVRTPSAVVSLGTGGSRVLRSVAAAGSQLPRAQAQSAPSVPAHVQLAPSSSMENTH